MALDICELNVLRQKLHLASKPSLEDHGFRVYPLGS